MNRIRKDNKGVSPVIATILMVAITVVLAGVLVVYLQTLPSGAGDVQTTIGTRVNKQGSDWMIEITSGNKNPSDVTIQCVVPATGAARWSEKVNALTAANAVYNNNNGNTKIDAGDTILLKGYLVGPPATGCQAGEKIQFLIGDNVVGTIKELPS